jgi:hypothetical protein
LSESVQKDFKLNTALLGNSQPRIDRVNTSQITKYSTAQLKKIFDGKIILVGSLNLPEINALTREAMAIDQIIRARDPQQFIPLLIYRSISEQFLWIFLWSILMGLVAWQRQWKLLSLAILFGELIISGICLMLGQGLPIIVTSITMISVGGTIRMLIVGADTEHQLATEIPAPNPIQTSPNI